MNRGAKNDVELGSQQTAEYIDLRQYAEAQFVHLLAVQASSEIEPKLT